MPRKSVKKNKTTKKVSDLLQHTKVKPLAEWKNAHQAHKHIQKMDANQLALYSAVIDHARGKTDIKHMYPFADTKLIDAGFKDHDKHAIASLARNSGSANSLARWHRKVWAGASSGKSFDKKASGIGSALKSGGKAIAKGAKWLASKGVSLAKAAWATTKKIGLQMKKMGAKATKWMLNPKNISKLNNIVELIKSGVSVVKMLQDMGAAGPLPADALDQVSKEHRSAVEDILGDDSESSSADEDDDEGGMTLEEMMAKEQGN